PDVAAGRRLDESSVVDVCPTVLHGMGMGVPETTVGTVLTDLFADGSESRTRAVTRASYAGGGATVSDSADDADTAAADGDDDDEEFEGVEERLRGLGYME
ncbi:phosphodiesterase, partial [Halobium palmae]